MSERLKKAGVDELVQAAEVAEGAVRASVALGNDTGEGSLGFDNRGRLSGHDTNGNKILFDDRGVAMHISAGEQVTTRRETRPDGTTTFVRTDNDTGRVVYRHSTSNPEVSASVRGVITDGLQAGATDVLQGVAKSVERQQKELQRH